jgi:hypothetical protein
MTNSKFLRLNRLCRGGFSALRLRLDWRISPDIAVLNELSNGDYIDHKQKQSGGYYLRSGMRATSVELDDPKLHRRKAKRLSLVDKSDESCVIRLFASLTSQVQERHL